MQNSNETNDAVWFNVILIIILMLASSLGVLTAQTSSVSMVKPYNTTLVINVQNPNTTVTIDSINGTRVVVESSIDVANKATATYVSDELRPVYYNYDDVDMIEIKKSVIVNKVNAKQHLKIYVPASITLVIDQNGNKLN